MRKLRILFTSLLFAWSYILPFDATALEKATHFDLNGKIVVQNQVSLNTYLKLKLGLSKGIEEIINGKQVIKWIQEGGVKEDEPLNTRSFNHFHNPLKPWDSAGLKGTFQSAVIWAQEQETFGSLFGGDWSWKKARESFHKGLTAVTKTDREKNLADTFRALGQVMHLIQDVSVPAHTRDDAHVVGYHYEKAVDKLRTSNNPIFLDAVANPVAFDSSILSYSPNPLAPIPIAKIFDTDIYYNTNPDPNVTALDTIGLSEYTNANFVSEGLFAANFQDFFYPRIENTSIVPKLYTGTLGTYTRQYYLKNCCGETNTGNGYLLAVVDYLDYWRQKYPLLSAVLPKLPILDDNVYKDYAALLIPRAVGYSAGLLDYFFRGNIEITLPTDGVYSQTDDLNQGFTNVTLLARNTTSAGEQMTDGSIELVVKYRLALEDPFRNYSEDYPFQAENSFRYIVVPEANDIRSIPRDSPVSLTFDLSQNPIPLYAIDVYLQVVYKGSLGNEDGVVSVGFKDISEPTPVDLFNDMDRICLNGIFYVAGSPEAIAQVDTNNNGIADEWDVYAHDAKDIYLRFSPASKPRYASTTEYNFHIPSLTAGNFLRAFFILTDYQFNYSSYNIYVKKDPEDPWIHSPLPVIGLYSGKAIKNQTDYVEDVAICDPLGAPCYVWWYPTFLAYRGVELWWGGGIMFINNAYPVDSECSCYEGILRTCPSGAQAQKTMDTMKQERLLKEHSVNDSLGSMNVQMMPLIERQRRNVAD
ncbi:MAG: hypothetical protein IBX72_10780 [Nitrospirae bacterium]|jgi:hypothetical protein|nr:hypothetical protein [Nitrospirota bacterium]